MRLSGATRWEMLEGDFFTLAIKVWGITDKEKQEALRDYIGIHLVSAWTKTVIIYET